MNKIKQIKLSRDILKNYLEKEWDIDSLSEYSYKEIQTLLTTKVPKKNIISFGEATACNFSLQNRYIPSHYLHVIYYNFSEIGKPPLKVTKTCADKIKQLYTDNIIQKEDSIILILECEITDNIKSSIEELFIQLQGDLKKNNLSEEIINQNKENYYSLQHFSNIHLWSLKHLTFDIRKHTTVPNHEAIRDKQEIAKILEDNNTILSQLPIIKRNDPQAKVLRLGIGDICKIIRYTTTGETIYYRVCN